jgi:serine/threonine protein kinase
VPARRGPDGGWDWDTAVSQGIFLTSPGGWYARGDDCRGQMSAEEVRMLMWQMLHGLKYLHTLNVWHRDIKSSNVMLGRKEGHKMVKVL